jgi:hypothetical protein
LGSKKRYGKYYRFSAYGKRIYDILGKRKTQRFLYQTLRSDMPTNAYFDTISIAFSFAVAVFLWYMRFLLGTLQS